jgi:hypothetical protein
MKTLTRFLTLVLLLGLMVVAVLPVMAQDEIAYGDVVEGEIEEEEEVEYVFEGTAGDLVVAHLWGTNLDDDLTSPTIELRDEDGDAIVTSSYTFREATISAVLEDDGEYTIAVIADTGNEGEYNLALYSPELLEAGASVDGELDADTEDQYYLVSGAEDVSINFAFADAVEYVPTFRVYNAEDMSLVGYFVSVVEEATGNFNLPGGETDFYLIAVEYSASDLLIYEDTASEYTITVE